jgi:hypothetical protein
MVKMEASKNLAKEKRKALRRHGAALLLGSSGLEKASQKLMLKAAEKYCNAGEYKEAARLYLKSDNATVTEFASRLINEASDDVGKRMQKVALDKLNAVIFLYKALNDGNHKFEPTRLALNDHFMDTNGMGMASTDVLLAIFNDKEQQNGTSIANMVLLAKRYEISEEQAVILIESLKSKGLINLIHTGENLQHPLRLKIALSETGRKFAEVTEKLYKASKSKGLFLVK